MNSLPYSEVFIDLLTAIHKSIWYCHKKYKSGEELKESDHELSKFFSSALNIKSYRSTGLDSHLVKGLTKSLEKRDKENIYPRLSKLVIYAYLNAQESKDDRYSAVIIPSPLNILYHALTDPVEPQTSAYAFVLCRGMLFYYLGLHPDHPDLNKISPNFESFSEEDVHTSISSFKRHIDIQLRWPDKRLKPKSFTTKINYLCGHILALKGYTYLWFNSDKQLKNFCLLEKQDDYKKLYCNDLKQSEKYSFRMSGFYRALPDASELNNWIFGVPIPLRGADLLFFGGLKKTFSGGLVISLYGQPGTGKTSTALSFCATMSPFNTKSVYISLEENPEDLKIRLKSLVPDYLRRMSIYEDNDFRKRHKKDNDLDWFTTLKFSDNLHIDDLTDILIELKSRVEKEEIRDGNDKKGYSIPATCPFILVIDNVNELFEKEVPYEDIEGFIDQCRNMGAFVILIAANDIPKRYRLDYMVDVAMHLTQEDIDSKIDKPVRVVQLLKTRHQMSRQGAHVFHLSNSKGFRISPQIPSQMDKREKIRIRLPSYEEYIHTLNFINKDEVYEYNNFLPIASKSQILVHGHGSTGKAGFGLKLLLTPIFTKKVLSKYNPKTNKGELNGGRNDGKIWLDNQKNTKVLIISFLYPDEYYEFLETRLEKQFNKAFKGYDRRKSSIRVKAFYPGYLTPEDFVYKIVRLLEEARLEGEPYTGVLLDGLHNVFLQFKNLQKEHMIWPLLYSMLSRYNVSVVTTFTNFSLNEGSGDISSHTTQTPEDFMLLQQGQKPFLHGLVKAADYFFMLEEVVPKNGEREREYLVSIRSSIRQIPPNEALKWDRQTLSIYDKIKAEKNPFVKPETEHQLEGILRDILSNIIDSK
jgi:KaiC/GvpD/RAD55 family RecA-like ATPase